MPLRWVALIGMSFPCVVPVVGVDDAGHLLVSRSRAFVAGVTVQPTSVGLAMLPIQLEPPGSGGAAEVMVARMLPLATLLSAPANSSHATEKLMPRRRLRLRP